MKAKFLFLFMATAFCGFALSQGMKVEDVLGKYYEAMGGKDVLSKINSMQVSGKMIMSMGENNMEMPIKISIKDNKKIRFDASMQGMTMTQAYDGEDGWQIMPMMGVNEPQDIAEEELKTQRDRADITGPLWNWKDKGNKVELQGKEEVEGTDAYKVKLTTKDGEEQTYWIDSEYFVIIKASQTVTQAAMGSMETHSFPSDYKEVNGYMVPHVTKLSIPMTGQTMTMQFEEVKINAEIEDSIFTRPATEAKEDQ